MTPTDFWDFSLAVYAKPGVAPLCVSLQDQWQLDVNLLLFCLHAGHQGHLLSDVELQLLNTTAAPWRDHVVRPLRDVRRWLKTQAQAHAQTQAPALPGATDATALRQQAQAIELAAERCQQIAMAQMVKMVCGAPSRGTTANNLAAAAALSAPRPDAALAEVLAALVEAAFAGNTSSAAGPTTLR